MRIAFFALLLVNVLLFAWGAWLQPAPAAIASSAPAAPRLQLSSEVPQVPRQCVSVGPFTDEATERQAARVLLEAGYETRGRDDRQRIIDGYWVSLASPGEGREEQRLLQRLRRAGVTDASPILDAIQGRRLSLGVFSDEDRAKAQAARASAIGVEAAITPREREEPARWLDFQLRTDAPGFAESQFTVGTAVLQFRPCPPADQSGGAAIPGPDGAAVTGGADGPIDAITSAPPAP